MACFVSHEGKGLRKVGKVNRHCGEVDDEREQTHRKARNIRKSVRRIGGKRERKSIGNSGVQEKRMGRGLEQERGGKQRVTKEGSREKRRDQKRRDEWDGGDREGTHSRKTRPSHSVFSQAGKPGFDPVAGATRHSPRAA